MGPLNKQGKKIMAQVNSEKAQNIATHSEQKKQTKINHKYNRDKDREMVKGIFRFHEVPGGRMAFPFRAYKEDDVEIFDLIDGQVYTIPLGVARHLNKNCWYPVYDYIKGESGIQGGYASNVLGANSTMRVTTKVRRCSFQSLEFVDIDDLNPQGNSGVSMVETIG